MIPSRFSLPTFLSPSPLGIFSIKNTFQSQLQLLPKKNNGQGEARAVNLPARSFDLAHPGVVPPLRASRILRPTEHTIRPGDV